MTVVQRSDTGRAVGILVAAFADDPLLRWLGPDDGSAVFAPTVAASEAAGELAFAADDAVAVWLPVPAAPPGAAEHGPLPERLRIFLELVSARHPRGRAHLYLPFLGVRPERQGRGTGGRLLAERLARADAEALPAYLEADTPRSVPLYERHGFRLTGDPISLPDGPSIHPMWREPHTSRGDDRP